MSRHEPLVEYLNRSPLWKEGKSRRDGIKYYDCTHKDDLGQKIQLVLPTDDTFADYDRRIEECYILAMLIDPLLGDIVKTLLNNNHRSMMRRVFE